MPKPTPPETNPQAATPPKTAPKSWRKTAEEIEAMEIRSLREAFREAGLKV